MAYTKQTWSNGSGGGTPTSAARFNYMEDGIEAAAAPTVPATTQSGTTYTLALGDAGTVVEFTSASSVTLTVPTNASVAFATGTVIELLQYGAGVVTVSPAGGVTIRSPGGLLAARVQYSSLSLRKRGTNEWVLAGDLA